MLSKIQRKLLNKNLPRIAGIFLLFLFGILTAGVFFSHSALAANPNDYFGSTGKWKDDRSDPVQLWQNVQDIFDNQWKCTSAGSTTDQPVIGIFESVGNNAAGGGSAAQKYYGLSNSDFLNKAYSVFANINPSNTCSGAAGTIKSMGLTPKTCADTAWVNQCGSGSGGSDKAAKIQAIVTACNGFWADKAGLDDATAAKNLYTGVLTSLTTSDFNKVVSDVGSTSSAGDTQCSKAYDDVKIGEKAVTRMKGDLNELCKSDKDALDKIKDLNGDEIAAAWQNKDQGCDAALSAAADASGDAGDDNSTCKIDGIGWIVCPVMRFLAKLNDAAFGFLNGFLTVPGEVFSNGSMLQAWSSFRDIANVAFILAFLIIVYSQMTGAGINNYGIKKMLPKLIIAAILVNASYWICGIAIDISNILGNSLFSFLKEAVKLPSVGGDGAVAGAWSGIVEVVLAAVSVVALIALVIFAPITLLAFAMVILILIARQAFVILLVVISPLAFVAYLLPNTEEWFTRWRKAFTAVLMVFPIIAIIFGASTLAANVLLSVGQGNDSTYLSTGQDAPAADDGDKKNMLMIVALGVMAIPLFAVPAALKGSMAAAGSVGAKLSGMQDKATGRARQGIKDSRLGEAKGAFDARRSRRKLERRVGERNYLGVIPSARINKAIDRSRFGRYIGGDRGAAKATSEYNKEVAEETERQMSTMSDLNADQLLNEAMDKKNSSERRAAALRKLETAGGDQHIQAAYDYLAKEGAKKGTAGYDKDIGDVQQLAAAALQKRKPAGVSTTQANALGTGTLGLNHEGKVDAAAAGGYKTMLQSRVQSGAFGAGDYARMGKDDLIRLAEMSRDGQLNPIDIAAIQERVKDIDKDETLKGTMTAERRALFDSINTGTGPKRVDGSEHKLRPL